MARLHLVAGFAVLLGGCADPALPPGDEGWHAVAGTDGVQFTGRWLGCAGTCEFEATVRNGGDATYRVNDGCAGSWFDWEVRDAQGGLLTSPHRIVCAMCDAGAPFPPGAERTKVWAWNRLDDRGFRREGPGQYVTSEASPGPYVATLQVVLGHAEEPDCGPSRAYASGPFNVTFRL